MSSGAETVRDRRSSSSCVLFWYNLPKFTSVACGGPTLAARQTYPSSCARRARKRRYVPSAGPWALPTLCGQVAYLGVAPTARQVKSGLTPNCLGPSLLCKQIHETPNADEDGNGPSGPLGLAAASKNIVGRQWIGNGNMGLMQKKIFSCFRLVWPPIWPPLFARQGTHFDVRRPAMGPGPGIHRDATGPRQLSNWLPSGGAAQKVKNPPQPRFFGRKSV